MRSVAFVSICCALIAGCARGAPPGFSPGEHWTLPLVDPLADGKLLTPVYIEDRGPFLFAIDPDAPRSIVERSAAAGGTFPILNRGRLIDEADVGHPAFDVQVVALRAGDLTVDLPTLLVARDGSFNDQGRRIHGVLGRDVIADSVAFGFDRDRGIAWLTTHDVFAPPAGATVVPFDTIKYALRRRSTVEAHINGKPYELALDFSKVPSRFWVERWREAAVAPAAPRTVAFTDDTGRRQRAQIAARAATIRIGDVTRHDVELAPFSDQRHQPWELQGSLGLGFLAPYVVVLDRHNRRLYLTPRADRPSQTVVRLGRWPELARTCPSGTCVRLEVDAAAGGMRVTRDPAAIDQDLEVILAATSAAGAPLAPVAIHLPRGIGEVRGAVGGDYTTARYHVLDLSPFPRACGGCIGAAEGY